MRGGEKVLEAILEMYPAAEIFTLFHFPRSVSEQIERHQIHTSHLQQRAAAASDYRRLLPFFPHAAERWNFDSYDLVISSSHCVAKGVRTGSVPHLSYCHTPMRYMWDRFDDYFPYSKPLLRAAALPLRWWLRRWDVRTSQGVSRFAANSRFVQQRIKRFYSREASVIYPFASSAFFSSPTVAERQPYHLIVSALVPYKRIDVAIDAAERSGKKIIIIGDGPLRFRFESRASETVKVLGWVSQEELIRYMSEATSLILPGVEDFGITPLEALARGTPVVALRDGGVVESVPEGSCGVFFDQCEPEALAAALERVEAQVWNRELLRARAAEFSKGRFQGEFQAMVDVVTRGS